MGLAIDKTPEDDEGCFIIGEINDSIQQKAESAISELHESLDI